MRRGTTPLVAWVIVAGLMRDEVGSETRNKIDLVLKSYLLLVPFGGHLNHVW